MSNVKWSVDACWNPLIARPLTSSESARIRKAQLRIDRASSEAKQQVEQAVALRDAEIARAVDAGAQISDIARALGLTRQGVYVALARARDRQ
jgi:DNA-binding NarL/FixJ family response regulator